MVLVIVNNQHYSFNSESQSLSKSYIKTASTQQGLNNMGCQSAEVHENFDVAPGPGTIARTTKHPNMIIVDEKRLLQNNFCLPWNKKCLKRT